MSASFRCSIFVAAQLEHKDCTGGCEMRTAAPAIQGGGRADQKRPGAVNAVFYFDERLSSRHSDSR
jgi:hypothetical protein